MEQVKPPWPKRFFPEDEPLRPYIELRHMLAAMEQLGITEKRGEKAVLHHGETRGRRSKNFPDVNISQTAKRLGVCKSHLVKILNGSNTPSLDLAVRLAEILGVTTDYVIALRNKA